MFPADSKKRSVLAIINYRAQTSPNTTCLRQLDSNRNVAIELTYKELRTAVNGAASWISSCISDETYHEHPVAFLGEADLRYLLIPLGLAKLGGVCQNLSRRNSPEANLGLLRSSKSRVLVYSGDALNLLPDEYRFHDRFKAPGIGEFLNLGKDAVPLEDNEEYETAPLALLIMQSSGTTGHPKCIKIRMNAFAASQVQNSNCSAIDGCEPIEKVSARTSNVWMQLPIFQSSGFTEALAYLGVFGRAVTLPPASAAVDTEFVLRLIDAGRVHALYIPPQAVLELAQRVDQDQHAAAILRKLDYITSAGAPIPREAGDRLAGITRIIPRYASTETFTTVGQFVPVQLADWEWIHLPVSRNSIRWEQGSDGTLYEMVIMRDQKLQDSQGYFKNFPEENEFRSKDLFEPHPSLKDHWRCVSRTDDAIVLSNMQKLHPHIIEQNIVTGRNVDSAMVTGNQRLFPTVLVQPKSYPSSEESLTQFGEEVWSRVEKSNASNSAAGQIKTPEQVIVAKAEKPFAKSAKNLVNKKATGELYGSEIEEKYKTLDGEALKPI